MSRIRSISFPPSLRRSFTRAAKKAFPKETFAFCFGTKSGGVTYVEELFYPEIIMDADGLGFVIPDKALALAHKLARENGLLVICNLHSHPYPDQPCDPLGGAPSEIDWDFNYRDQLMGICQIHEIGGKLRARYRFWPPLDALILLS